MLCLTSEVIYTFIVGQDINVDVDFKPEQGISVHQAPVVVLTASGAEDIDDDQCIPRGCSRLE